MICKPLGRSVNARRKILFCKGMFDGVELEQKEGHSNANEPKKENLKTTRGNEDFK